MEWDEVHDYPRKWFDKKQYVRIDSDTGLPQLIRVEPVVTEDGDFIPDSVKVFIDDGPMMIMGREAADVYIDSLHCTPLEITAQWKHQNEN